MPNDTREVRIDPIEVAGASSAIPNSDARPEARPDTVAPPPTGASPAPSSAPSPDTGAQPPQAAALHRLKLSFRQVKLWTKRGLATIATLSTVIVAGSFFWLVADAALRQHRLSLATISVSKRLAEDGFTGSVATQRLRDEIKAVQARAETRMAMNAADVHQDMSSVTIPKIGLSVESVAASIRRMLPDGWVHEVSGEFVATEAGLRLRLRLNGEVVFSQVETGPEAADLLVQRGAVRVIEKTQPYVAASALYVTDPDGALAAATQIISTHPDTDESVRWAHVLRGLIWRDRGKLDDAIAEYQTAIHLDPKNAFPRNNLANIWKEQGRLDDAIKEYQNAIRLDPKNATPHYNLAVIWKGRGKLDDAINEYQTAIRLDPKDSFPHNNLGNIWAERGKADGAIKEYQTAIHLDPNNAAPHTGLGAIWTERGKLNDAIAEYQTAIRLDPKDATPRYNLGQILVQHALKADPPTRMRTFQTACSEFMEGGRLAPDNPNFPARIRGVDWLLAGGAHCPP